MYASVTMGISLPSPSSYPITLSKARLVVRTATMAVEVRRLSVDMLEIPLSPNPDWNAAVFTLCALSSEEHNTCSIWIVH
jgi:hypothetical protein